MAADHHVFLSDTAWGVVRWKAAPVWLHAPAAEDVAMFVGVFCGPGGEGKAQGGGEETTSGNRFTGAAAQRSLLELDAVSMACLGFCMELLNQRNCQSVGWKISRWRIGVVTADRTEEQEQERCIEC